MKIAAFRIDAGQYLFEFHEHFENFCIQYQTFDFTSTQCRAFVRHEHSSHLRKKLTNEFIKSFFWVTNRNSSASLMILSKHHDTTTLKRCQHEDARSVQLWTFSEPDFSPESTTRGGGCPDGPSKQAFRQKIDKII